MHFIISRKTKPLTKSDISLQTHKPPIDTRDQPLHRAGNRECRDRTIKDLVNSSIRKTCIQASQFHPRLKQFTVATSRCQISNKKQNWSWVPFALPSSQRSRQPFQFVEARRGKRCSKKERGAWSEKRMPSQAMLLPYWTPGSQEATFVPKKSLIPFFHKSFLPLHV